MLTATSLSAAASLLALGPTAAVHTGGAAAVRHGHGISAQMEGVPVPWGWGRSLRTHRAGGERGLWDGGRQDIMVNFEF